MPGVEIPTVDLLLRPDFRKHTAASPAIRSENHSIIAHQRHN